MILRAAYRVPILARVGAPARSKILLYSAAVYPTTSQIEVAVKKRFHIPGRGITQEGSTRAVHAAAPLFR
jgi:hypothetical protein